MHICNLSWRRQQKEYAKKDCILCLSNSPQYQWCTVFQKYTYSEKKDKFNLYGAYNVVAFEFLRSIFAPVFPEAAISTINYLPIFNTSPENIFIHLLTK